MRKIETRHMEQGIVVTGDSRGVTRVYQRLHESGGDYVSLSEKEQPPPSEKIQFVLLMNSIPVANK